MRELIDFFVRFNALFFFIVFESICFFLIGQNNTYHRASILNSSNAFVGSIFNFSNNMSGYFQLRTVNDSLIAENKILKEQLANVNTNQNVITQLKIDSIPISNDSTIAKKYMYYEADVINNSTNKLYNNITLNRGSNDGIKPEMGLVDANGVVGIIKSVSPKYSMAMSLLHKNAKISARIKKNDYTGTIIWNGQDARFAELQDIPKHVELLKNDAIITSGYSSIFPADVLIGNIESFELKEGSNFYKIKVKLASNFQKLRYVYAVENLNKQEQVELEVKTRDE